jgi:hypothetical protein
MVSAKVVLYYYSVIMMENFAVCWLMVTGEYWCQGEIVNLSW